MSKSTKSFGTDALPRYTTFTDQLQEPGDSMSLKGLRSAPWKIAMEIVDVPKIPRKNISNGDS